MSGEDGRPDLTIAGVAILGTSDVAYVESAVVCIKGIDTRDKTRFWTRATDGVTMEEAQGMALALLDDIRAMRRAEVTSGPDDELTAVKSPV